MGAYSLFVGLLQSGLGNLASYLAAHVLLCLLPAFFIAGGLTALVPKEAVTRFLGRKAPKYISYPAAAVGGFVLAVCSCTILPLFSSIYKKGAGLGPAITFLFVGPAINILALSYTGVALGMDIAVARLVLSILFGIGIGLIMAMMFPSDDADPAQDAADGFAAKAGVPGRVWLFMGLLLALLIVGTLQVRLFTTDYATISLPIKGMDRLQETLNRWVPFNASRGEEGVTAQGDILIVSFQDREHEHANSENGNTIDQLEEHTNDHLRLVFREGSKIIRRSQKGLHECNAANKAPNHGRQEQYTHHSRSCFTQIHFDSPLDYSFFILWPQR